ncbi:MAG: aspartate kinase [Chloroflexi bacterium]|nr:aspartate kinase [Chloroflexota bacterium]
MGQLVVQKYGGSSVANAARMKNVARRIAAARDDGKGVVVVVSAMGDTTEDLILLAHQVTDHPDDRELDVLLSTGEVMSSTLMAMALGSLGYDAISLTGYQAGIKTDSRYSRARITDIDPQRIERELNSGKIVIVAGFQGITEEMDITTLGRGGSDTTAVALAASLKADSCEIYTDVDGVFSADPRVVPEARKLSDISYEEMLELAVHGARVMHPRAVELGELYQIPILVASSFNNHPGTVIHGGVTMENRNKVRGIAHDMDVAKITLVGVPDRPGVAASLFEPLAEAGVSIDTIVQNAGLSGIADLSFTVSKNDLDKAMRLIGPVAESVGATGVHSSKEFGKVSIVGSGMQTAPGYAARMFKSLHDAGINIEMITTSEIRITCIIQEDKVKDALRALHKSFKLETGE